eukprot:jgi/Undpi1/13006/HiC_scaffold_7.g02670.m1
MVLSDPQIELLAKTLGVSAPSNEALATDFQKTFPRAFGDLMTNSLGEPLAMYEALETRPCAWNMFLRRSPTVMSSLQEHSPWGMVMGDAGMHHHPTEYIAWHIRTSEGETATSYDPKVHPHVLEEPASAVCPAYLAATGDLVEAAQTCRRPHALGGSDEIGRRGTGEWDRLRLNTKNVARAPSEQIRQPTSMDDRPEQVRHENRGLSVFVTGAAQGGEDNLANSESALARLVPISEPRKDRGGGGGSRLSAARSHGLASAASGRSPLTARLPARGWKPFSCMKAVAWLRLLTDNSGIDPAQYALRSGIVRGAAQPAAYGVPPCKVARR